MTEPKITSTINGYRLEWAEDKLEIVVSRIRVHSDGKITGDVSLILGKAKQVEPSFNFNFTSEQTRKRLTNSLIEKYPDWKDNWMSIIDELSRQIQKSATEGEPVIQITSNDDVFPLEYLVSPIIPLNKPTAIFGDPGAGKSQLLLILAIVAALPWHDNPLKLGAPKESTPILYLDYEADPDDLRRSLRAFVDGMELGWVPIHYRRCSIPIAEDIEAIRNHADAVGAKAIFIDSTSLAAGGDLNKMDVATSYIRALRQMKLTSVSLSHTSKDRESKSKTIIGSVLFEAGFRSVFECRGQEDEHTLDIALFHRKFNLGAKQPTMGYRISYNGQGNTVEWYDPSSVPEFVARMSIAKQILDLLKSGSKTLTEITDDLGVSMPAASMALKRLANKNHVTKLAGKQWGLLSKEDLT